MARYLTNKDRTVRARWAQFLGPLVGDDLAVTSKRLTKVMSAQLARKGDAKWQVDDWLDGDRTVSPALAFEAGEALRACGIAWCSGPLALYAAGYLSEWVETIASIWSLTDGADAAVNLAVFAPIAVLRASDLRADLSGAEAWSQSIRTGLNDTAKAWRKEARSILAETLAGTETLQWVFEHELSENTNRANAEMKMWLLESTASAARNADAKPGDDTVEPFVLNALREWAVSTAKPERRMAIVEYTFRLQQARMDRIRGTVAEIERVYRVTSLPIGEPK